MDEYIEFVVRVPKGEADLFIARFGIESVTIFGYQLNEEITRCRNCKYYMSYWHSNYCDYFSHATNGPGGFCAWGEQREEGETK